jgi:hypothetical protein
MMMALEEECTGGIVTEFPCKDLQDLVFKFLLLCLHPLVLASEATVSWKRGRYIWEPHLSSLEAILAVRDC